MSGRLIRPGELLAIDSSAIGRGDAGFFLLCECPIQPNERIDDVCVVKVRGSLEHHKSQTSDNYESIIERVGWGMRGGPGEEGFDPPTAIILDVDSMGGVVAGLNETVMALRAMSRESKIPIYALVNELAASAAYALCCAAEEICCPESAILGSVGVISTMASQVKADEKAGIEVVLITSGARKADGHAHAPIEPEAIAAERIRVNQSAQSFYELVKTARGLSTKKIQGLQANIYQGKDAVRLGLADDILNLKDAILAVSDPKRADKALRRDDNAKGNETDRRALDKTGLYGSKSREPLGKSGAVPMAMKLSALIKKTEAAIAVEKDASKLSGLLASLDAFKKTKHHIETKETEEHDEPDGDEPSDDEEDDGEEKDAKKTSEEEEAATKTSGKKMKKSAKKADEEEEEEAKASGEEDEEEEAKAQAAVLAMVKRATKTSGKGLTGALSALLEKAAGFDDLTARVASIEGSSRKATRQSLIDAAVHSRRITKHMGAQLAGKKLEFVTSYLEMHKAPIVNLDEDALEAPSGAPGAELPRDVMQMIDSTVAVMNFTPEKAAAFKAQLITDNRKRLSETNGLSRY